MADEKKNVTGKVEEATTDTKKAAAEKVAKAAKGSKTQNKPKISVRMKNGAVKARKAIVRFFKDFRGETKKIVWPDAKTVFKNTGIVLLVVTVVALIVLLFDSVLAFIIQGLQGLATGSGETTTAVADAVSTTVAGSTTTTAAGTTTTTAAAGMIGFFSNLIG